MSTTNTTTVHDEPTVPPAWQRTCQSCQTGILQLVGGDSGDSGRNVHEHYYCRDCPAGGTIIKSRKTDAVVRRVGPAVNPQETLGIQPRGDA